MHSILTLNLNHLQGAGLQGAGFGAHGCPGLQGAPGQALFTISLTSGCAENSFASAAITSTRFEISIAVLGAISTGIIFHPPSLIS